MATITNANLAITHDHRRKTARCVVTCKVNFTQLELCLMKTCGNRWFKLRCELWGADSGLTGSDDYLFTYDSVRYYPDATPSATENATFDVTLGEGVLNEDGFFGGYTDEVYGKLKLTNLSTLQGVTRKTNVISHNF